MLSKIPAALAFLALPPAAFYGGYRLTDWFFRWKLLPVPFEPYGLAVGIGLSCWTVALLVMILKKREAKGGMR